MSGPADQHMSSDTPSVGCEYWLEDLKAYLDDELPIARRRAIETHLASCAACTKELRIMQTIQEELQADEESQQTPFDPALKSRILDSASGPEGKPLPRGRGNTWELPKEPVTRRRTGGHRWYEYALLASLVLFTGLGVLTMMGGRIKNTFNTAAGSINTSIDSESPPAASSSTGDPNVWKSQRAAQPNTAPLGQTEQAAPPESVVQPIPPMPEVITPPATTTRDTTRRIQRRASIALAVQEVEVASSTVEARVKESGGYVVSNTLNTSEGQLRTANLEVKVPVNRFEVVMRQISGLGEVRAKDVTGQDVTEQFVSTNARRGALRGELSIRQAQLRELERRSRTDVEARWQLQTEVRRLRVETAEAQARLNYLQKSTDLSDISVVLNEKKPEPKPMGFMEEVGNSGRKAWSSFTEAAKIPATALIWIIAYSPFWIPALILWRKYGFTDRRGSAGQQS